MANYAQDTASGVPFDKGPGAGDQFGSPDWWDPKSMWNLNWVNDWMGQGTPGWTYSTLGPGGLPFEDLNFMPYEQPTLGPPYRDGGPIKNIQPAPVSQSPVPSAWQNYGSTIPWIGRMGSRARQTNYLPRRRYRPWSDRIGTGLARNRRSRYRRDRSTSSGGSGGIGPITPDKMIY